MLQNQTVKYVLASLVFPFVFAFGYVVWHIYRDIVGYPDIDIKIIIGDEEGEYDEGEYDDASF